MLFMYDKDKGLLEPCKETRFADHGLLERQNIELWVAQYPEILGEDLLIITTEYDQFDKTSERLDLLALDRDGNLVVVELKRDDSGKNVELQALKYAAYCSTLRFQNIVEIYRDDQARKGQSLSLETSRDALLQFIENDEFEELNERPRIILVAKEFRQEVTASVIWLRKCGLDITCVKLSPYILSEGKVAFNCSVLIPWPEAKNFVIQSERRDSSSTAMTVTQTEYIDFFREAVNLLRKMLPREYAQPDGRSFYKILTGFSGIHFEWGFHGRPRSSLGVELHFETSNPDVNRAFLDQLLLLSEKIEAKIGLKPVFEREWRKNWSRVYVEKHDGNFTEDLKLWAAEKMFEFIQLLQPEVEKLKMNQE